jgi:hypothetical protein
MKQLIRKILKEQDEIINVPDLDFFDGSWEDLLAFTKGRKFRVRGDLDLRYIYPETLGNMISVDGNLDLYECKNIKSLGLLEYVDGWLDLNFCESLTSLGSLKYVGGWLELRGTPIAEKYSREEIRQIIEVDGVIFI